MAESFEPLYTADEMRAAEERYPEYPDSIPELMERAGAAVAREAMLAFPAARSFACVCGGGSNGGDGRVAARVLRESGHVADETTEPDGYDVVVDALFGTGFHGEPREDAAGLIERINAASGHVVAVDLPSGVDASSGEVAGAVVNADSRSRFMLARWAWRSGRAIPRRARRGRRHRPRGRVDPASTSTAALLSIVPHRGARDTKYSSGSVLVVGGAPGMTGAACLSAMAALRADAGYVTLAVPEEPLRAAEILALEPVKIGWSDADAAETIATAAERATALAIGPGLGRGDRRAVLVRELLERLPIPAVVDADALFGLEPFDAAQPLSSHRTQASSRGCSTPTRAGSGRIASRRRSKRPTVRGRRRPEGRRHDRRGARRRRHRLRSRAAVARDCRHGRRPHGRDRGVPRQRPRAAARGGGRSVAHARAAELAPHRTGLVASDLLASLPAALEA